MLLKLPKLKTWSGELPKESISIKLDGIQGFLNDNGHVVSRAGMGLLNISPSLLKPGKIYEIYAENFKLTDQILSTYKHPRKIVQSEVYEIWPDIDSRLHVPLSYIKTFSLDRIYNHAVSNGYEGLIIDRKYKMKPVETHDVPVTGIIPAKEGKFSGMMGALMTPRGKVGTGFTTAQRQELWTIGEVIEVECMQLTAKGKFRHARFIRRRWDKFVPIPTIDQTDPS